MGEEGGLSTSSVVECIDEVVSQIEHVKLWLTVALDRQDTREGVWDGPDYTDDDRAEAGTECAEREAELATLDELNDEKLHEIECSLMWLLREIERRKGAEDPADDANLEEF